MADGRASIGARLLAWPLTIAVLLGLVSGGQALFTGSAKPAEPQRVQIYGAKDGGKTAYALIPLDAGNFSRSIPGGIAVDDSGSIVIVGGRQTGDLRILRPSLGQEEVASIPMQATQGQQLSGNGERFFFRSRFDGTGQIAFLKLDDLSVTPGPATESESFSVDATGHGIVFQGLTEHTGKSSLQYLFYDTDLGVVRQLTDDPNAVRTDLPCLDRSATKPLISADGNTVVVMTAAALGGVSESVEPRCHVFRLNLQENKWRRLLTLPLGTSASAPSLSADGQWLAFSITQVVSGGIVRTLPAIVELNDAAATDPIPGTADYAGFDSVVTRDGSGVVVSSQADLDPEVGNADHNMELFLYDMSSSVFTQITDTYGGIGSTPGNCPPYEPRSNANGGIVLFEFNLYSFEACRLDGPQRSVVDGFGFGRVRALRKRQGNTGPTLDAPTLARVQAGEVLRLTYNATDAERDPISFFAQLIDGLDVPMGSYMTDHRNGTADLDWTTNPSNIGTHRVRVAAFDEGGGETFVDTTIVVCGTVVEPGDFRGLIGAIFSPDDPLICQSEADLNGDGLVSAADLVAFGRPESRTAVQ